MKGAKRAVLLLEDDPVIRQTLRDALTDEGYQVTVATTIAEARKRAAGASFDLALLDLNLPDGLSFDFCRDLKLEYPSLPVIFVTASVEEASAVRGLSLGATDYVRKPFGRQELLIKVKQLLKVRQGTIGNASLQIDLDRRIARAGEQEIHFSPMEFKILAALMENPGEAVNRDRLLTIVDKDGELGPDALTPHLSRIRGKLKKAGVTELRIVPVHGFGYRLTKLREAA